MGNVNCISKSAHQEESRDVQQRHSSYRTSESLEDEKLPAYSTSLNASGDSGIASIESCIEKLSKELRELSLDIHEHPELAWQEHRTHDVLVKFMKTKGFNVTPHAYGLETAWCATFEHGSGGPTIGFNSEMDALPSVGHACGHNLIAICGVASALALAHALKENDVAGKVILLGTPAEEKDGGKLNLLDAGAYKPMDVCLMLHPSPVGGLNPMLAVAEVNVEFHGKGAHAAGAPWEGINALDAAVQVYNNVSMYRQQIMPTDRIHGIIHLKEDQPVNVIPDYARVTYIVRSLTSARLQELKGRLNDIFKAAADSTGCKMTLKKSYEYRDVKQNQVLGQEWKHYMSERRKIEFSDEMERIAIGSTDFGSVTYALPAIHPIFAIDTPPKQGNHTPGFTKAAATMASHRKALEASMGLAASAWRFVTDEDFAKAAKEEFKRSAA